MTLDLKGKKVVVTGRKHVIERAIAEAVVQGGADVVIWMRKWNDEDGNEAKVLPITNWNSHRSGPTELHPICHYGASR